MRWPDAAGCHGRCWQRMSHSASTLGAHAHCLCQASCLHRPHGCVSETSESPAQFCAQAAGMPGAAWRPPLHPQPPVLQLVCAGCLHLALCHLGLVLPPSLELPAQAALELTAQTQGLQECLRINALAADTIQAHPQHGSDKYSRCTEAKCILNPPGQGLRTS